jgi:hypothetical protein
MIDKIHCGSQEVDLREINAAGRFQISSGAERSFAVIEDRFQVVRPFPSKPQSTHATVFHVHNVFHFKAEMPSLL